MRTPFVLAILALGCKPPEAPAPRPSTPPAQAVAAGEWPTYHGSYALDGLAAQAPPDAPEMLWRYKAGVRVHATPVVADGRIYVATSKGGLIALGLDGAELWKAQLGKDGVNASPIYVERTILLGSDAGTLYAVDAATGKEKWTYVVGDSIRGSATRVTLGGGRTGIAVVSQSDGSIHGVDLATGKMEWKTPGVERCDGSPSSLGGRLVLGSCASALHIFDVAKAGEKSTDVDLGGDSQVAGGVAMVGGLAFAGTRNGKVVAADVAGVKLLWSNDEGKKESFATPAVDDRRVVTGADDGKVRALDRATGATLWTYDAKESPTSPVIAGNRVVLGAGGTLLILNAGVGTKIWSAEVADELSAPAVVNGVIYVGADDGSVSAWGKK